MADEKDDAPAQYASPACFAHEVDPAYMWSQEAAGPLDVQAWRKAERARLIEARLAVGARTRKAWGAMIADHLEQAIGDPAGLRVSAYWPFRGEPDLRPLLERLAQRGARTALPVVVGRGRPLVFRAWRQGERLERGAWGIPVPAAGAELVPDVVISPVVGFDPSGFRLGYGGGFFDRTLAAMDGRPRVFGVGYGVAAIATIHPQPHDIPMDAIITEEGRLPAPPQG